MKKKPIPVKFKSKNLPIQIQSAFYLGAKQLRGYFEERFQDPYRADSGRFCWDYWSIPGQYRLLRTPAESFFPKEIITPFFNHLLNWGRSQLGCQMISHPWLSAYTDGCYQALHSDVPHGPFSFVYSLTPWKQRTFFGGETLIAKPKLLRYFSEIESNQSHEESDFLHAEPPHFNQLTVFDPRFPHGVRQVQGVDSILDSRLVIHGWFTDPRPMLEGALTFKKIMRPMDLFARSLLDALSSGFDHSGLLSLRLKIKPSGEVESIEVVTAHLIDTQGLVLSRTDLTREIRAAVIPFPKSSGPTWLTLPLILEGPRRVLQDGRS